MKKVIGFRCDYCHKIFNNKEKCIKHENCHKECKKIINAPVIQKQKENEVINDTSCWYIHAFEPNYKVFNKNGENVKLNSKQSNDDYAFYKELHLSQKPEFCCWIYECIVYGHNVRNGYIKTIAPTQEEAINFVRIRFTKYSENDDIVKEN